MEAVPPVGSRGKSPVGDLALSRRHFCENMLNCDDLKNDINRAYLHSLPTSVQYEMEEKSILRQKSGMWEATMAGKQLS